MLVQLGFVLGGEYFGVGVVTSELVASFCYKFWNPTKCRNNEWKYKTSTLLDFIFCVFSDFGRFSLDYVW